MPCRTFIHIIIELLPLDSHARRTSAPTEPVSTLISAVTAWEIAPKAKTKLDVVSIQWQFSIKILFSPNFYVMDTEQTPPYEHQFPPLLYLTNFNLTRISFAHSQSLFLFGFELKRIFCLFSDDKMKNRKLKLPDETSTELNQNCINRLRPIWGDYLQMLAMKPNSHVPMEIVSTWVWDATVTTTVKISLTNRIALVNKQNFFNC